MSLRLQLCCVGGGLVSAKLSRSDGDGTLDDIEGRFDATVGDNTMS